MLKWTPENKTSHAVEKFGRKMMLKCCFTSTETVGRLTVLICWHTGENVLTNESGLTNILMLRSYLTHPDCMQAYWPVLSCVNLLSFVVSMLVCAGASVCVCVRACVRVCVCMCVV